MQESSYPAPGPTYPADRAPVGESAMGGLDPRRWIAVVRRRWRLLAGVAAVVFLLIVCIAASLTPKYESMASVLVDPRGSASTASDASTPSTNSGAGAVDTNAVDTQVQLLNSIELARQVAGELRLDRDPEFHPVAGARPGGIKGVLSGLKAMVAPAKPSAQPADPVEAAARVLQKSVWVTRVGLTYVINISVKSQDARKAALIANTYAQRFIIDDLQARTGQVRQVNSAIAPRLSELTQEVQAADAAVQNYKINHGLLSANGATMAEQEVSNYNEQIASAKADAAEKLARLRAAQAQVSRGGGGADVGAALGSETIRSLRAQQADTSRHLAELLTRYGDRYPDVEKARGQLKDIEGQIQLEINRILSSLKADASASQQRVASLEASQGQARGTLASNNASQVGLLELQRRADASHAIYEAYLGASKQTSAQEGILQPDERVVSPATPAAKPSSPNMRLAVLAGLAAGLALGVLALGVAELFKDGLETGAEIEPKLGLASAGSIPTLASAAKGPARRRAPNLYIPDHPFSAFAEAFRSLRTFLVLPARAGEAPPRVIAVTSALPREGKSTTAFCLGQTMAMAGARTVLVDCDVRRRGVSQLAPAATVGVVQVMGGKTPLEQALVRDDKSGLWILPAAPGAAPVDLFSPDSLERLLADLTSRFEMVVLDTAPVLAIAETRLITSRADSTLLITQWRKTPIKAVEAAINLLLEARANLAGVSITRVDLRQQSRTGYGDRYYYHRAVSGYYVE